MANTDVFNNLKKNLQNDHDIIKDNEDINYLHELYKTRIKEANEIADLYVKLSESIRDRLTNLRHTYDIKSEEKEDIKDDEPIEKKKVKKITKKEKKDQELQKVQETEPTENIIDKIEKEEEPKSKKETKKEQDVPKKKGRKKKDDE
jgi:hypothetical protein